MIDRGSRKMPSLRRVAEFQHLDKEDPACYRCGLQELGHDIWQRANRWLDRAHIIDRCFGGSDEAWNLLPLCHKCHAEQQIFKPGEADAAMDWFQCERSVAPNKKVVIKEMTNDYGERLVYIYDGRKAVIYHDDWLVPYWPILLHSSQPLGYTTTPEGRIIAGVVSGVLFSGNETEWVLQCLTESGFPGKGVDLTAAQPTYAEGT